LPDRFTWTSATLPAAGVVDVVEDVVGLASDFELSPEHAVATIITGTAARARNRRTHNTSMQVWRICSLGKSASLTGGFGQSKALTCAVTNL